jgi:tetratricopeptide (TPR) repeat protein
MKLAGMANRVGFVAGLLRLAAGTALLLGLAILPVRADAAADKTALDSHFSELKTAPDAAAASAIDQQIWHIWLTPSDVDLAARMGAVVAAEQQGDLSTALDLVGKLIADHPDYAEGWNQRATVEYELNDFTDSLADIDKVLALEPRHFGALSGRVLIYLAEGDHAMALKAMLAALAIHPFLSEQALFPELSRPQTQT